MIVFKINGVKYNLASCWDEVTYYQYIRLLSAPNSLPHYIHIFTGISLETLEKAELKNLERISIALSFLTISPKFDTDAKPSKMVGPYVLPKDVTLSSLGQFEDLKALLNRMPKDLTTTENQLLISDLYLEACAIYTQKVKDGAYDNLKVPEVKELLKNYSWMEVTQTGSFFLFRPLHILTNTQNRYQSIKARLKKSIQDLPGYKESLDLLQRSLGSRGK